LSDIFEEVDEEVRKDKYSRLWKRYGKWFVSCAVALLISAVGYVQWQKYDFDQRAQSSTEFNAALRLINSKKPEEATRALAELAKSGTKGYSILAKFRAAGLKVQAGDSAAASEIYEAIAEDDEISMLYRDLARLYAIMQRLDVSDTSELSIELRELLSDDNPWRFSAREIAAVLALRKRDTKSAKKYFKMLTDDPKTPAGLRQRASNMLQAIDG